MRENDEGSGRRKGGGTEKRKRGGSGEEDWGREGERKTEPLGNRDETGVGEVGMGVGTLVWRGRRLPTTETEKRSHKKVEVWDTEQKRYLDPPPAPLISPRTKSTRVRPTQTSQTGKDSVRDRNKEP